MCAYYPESKVEISGFIARYYDMSMDVISLGSYFSMIRKAIQLMHISPSDRILDLGAGTGRNACLMMKYLSTNGELIGIDISKEMIAQFKKRCASLANAKIVNQRIDKSLAYEDEFNKAFISFVLHGFPQEVRRSIIRNACKALKKHGEFFILDYNEFSLKEMPLYLKIPFKFIECPYAFDFIEKDWQKILAEEGFNRFEKHLFFGGYIRLLKGVKKS
ncbi:MAG: methyltransferase domain-containing protein [Methanosarcinales archaeon]|uniref:Methyltransferase domain-containing protein n=1 Tax=Candidatus Ethanoperedens thermophilum TaxID=2766897 RepID=A0A848D9X1_9EURY|nr:methyltransferase domain-containing protein [Candidatus Ethanoperedens thermophilum]